MTARLKMLNLRSSATDRSEAARRVANRQQFSNHASTLTGEWLIKPWSKRGKLNWDQGEYTMWNEGTMAQKIDYAIYSYETPIAWHYNNVPDSISGGWIFTGQHFSETSMKHLAIARIIVGQARELQASKDRHPAGKHLSSTN